MANNDMGRLMAKGGGTVDPVSGNEVPPGALPQEVRDDIDAKLSEGEFVFPADVVRYIGLNRLMEIRDEAKKGLGKMAEQGQMGNSDQVDNPDELHGDDFNNHIDSIMAEVNGGKNHLNVGGMPSSNPIEVKQFKDAQGNSTFVTFMDGKPMTPIPDGAQEVGQQKQAEAAAEKLSPTETNRTSAKDTFNNIKNMQDPNYMNKVLQEKLMSAAFEAGKPKQQAATTEPKTAAMDTPFGDQLSKISESLDFNLIGDSYNSDMLSNELNTAGVDLNQADITPTPTDMSISTNTIPTTTEVVTQPTMFAAKGGLVTKRRKK